jgi:lysophospholipase L1-like esterase
MRTIPEMAHPNKLGYQVMAPLAEKAIVEVLGQNNY